MRTALWSLVIGAAAAFLEAASRRSVDLNADALKNNAQFAAAWSAAKAIYDRARGLAG